MKDQILRKQQQRYAALRLIYHMVNGETDTSLSDHEYLEAAQSKLGLSSADAQSALSYLTTKGLCEGVTLQSFSLTLAGVDEVEAAETHPEEGTDHFDSPDIYQVQNINVYGGAVGSIQSGSHNTANVAQQINAPPSDMANAILDLRRAAAQLSPEGREDAEAALDGIEEQAKADKPKAGLVRVYAKTLNEYLLAYAPTIAMLVQHILEKASR